MRTYIEPKMTCRVFEAENIVTASGDQQQITTDQQAANQLQSQLQSAGATNIATATWGE